MGDYDAANAIGLMDAEPAAARINVSYSAQKPDGTLGPPETVCFNFATQRTC